MCETLRRSRALPALGLALALALAFVAPASADALDDARAAGWVGERPDGYLGLVRDDAPSEVRSLVQEVNGRRASHYEQIASENGTTPVAVAALAGSKLVARTPSGQYYMDADGAWVKK
jgi:uncharacterized protein YdbL (DUF1318 family)